MRIARMGKGSPRPEQADGAGSACTPAGSGAEAGAAEGNACAGSSGSGEAGGTGEEAFEEVAADDAATQVLLAADNVWVWPHKRTRIMGRASLTLQRGRLFFAWLPYAPPAPAVRPPLPQPPTCMR
jgi:hypothetical protein